jgi:hypothetical protein
MQSEGLNCFYRLLLVAGCAFSGVSALASTPFAITASSVTMPTAGPTTNSSGDTSIPLGASQFTVTGIPDAGTLTIRCQYSGPTTQAKIPQECGIVGPGQVPVQAGETTVNGTVYFVPYGEVTPSLAELQTVPRPSSHLPATGMALAGALMLGLGLRRRTGRWLALPAFAVLALAGAVGISACGGNLNAMTPGAYPYSISAGFAETGSGTIQTATTTILVTVP